MHVLSETDSVIQAIIMYELQSVNFSYKIYCIVCFRKMKRSASSAFMTGWLKRSCHDSPSSGPSASTQSAAIDPAPPTSPPHPHEIEAEEPNVSTPSTSTVHGTAARHPVPHHQRAPVDIGCVIRKILNEEKVEEFELRECLTNRWKPSSKADTPFSMKGTTKRYLGLQHLTNFEWLGVSKEEGMKGAWCVWCSLFSVTGKGGGHHQSGGQALGQLVRQPLMQFNDLTGKNGDLTRHHSAAYHIHCGERAQEFLKRVSDVSSDVRNLLNKARAQMQEENRAKLHSIVSTVLFCARQNLAFRGHRDSGRLYKHYKHACAQVVFTVVCYFL